jgi:sugar/nucleoside kinase (ribokinase family)
LPGNHPREQIDFGVARASTVHVVLAVVGDLLEDVVVRTVTPPAVGTDTPATIDRRPGGSAANVAAAAASLGAAVRLICRVGVDPLGEQLVAALSAAGVDVRAQQHGRTGAVVVLVDGSGERTMLPDRAAAGELSDVDPTWLDGVTWLHVPAYSLLSEPIGTAARELITRVRATGGVVSIDASSVAVIESYGTDRFTGLLDHLAPDVVFANEPESVYLAHDAPWVTIVKRGPNPVTVLGDPDERGSYDVPVPTIDVVRDTTGAGDAFAAGYAVAAMSGGPVRDAVIAGINLAGDALRRRSSISSPT